MATVRIVTKHAQQAYMCSRVHSATYHKMRSTSHRVKIKIVLGDRWNTKLSNKLLLFKIKDSG